MTLMARMCYWLTTLVQLQYLDAFNLEGIQATNRGATPKEMAASIEWIF